MLYNLDVIYFVNYVLAHELCILELTDFKSYFKELIIREYWPDR